MAWRISRIVLSGLSTTLRLYNPILHTQQQIGSFNHSIVQYQSNRHKLESNIFIGRNVWAQALCCIKTPVQQLYRRNKTSVKTPKPWVCKGENPRQPKFYEDKNVVYVGGLGSLAYACIPRILKEGIRNLVIVDNVTNRKLVDVYRSVNRNCDITSLLVDLAEGQANIQRAVNNIEAIMGPIDILINGSGIINERKPAFSLRTNLLGVIQFTLAANRLMSYTQRGRGGIVVNIASVFGIEPGPFVAVFTAAQHGLIGFTRALANNYYYKHTRVAHIALCPGFTESDMLVQFDNTFDYATPLSDKLSEVKFQTADDFAKLMVPTIEKAENGTIWIIDNGEAKDIVLKTHLKSTMEVFTRRQLKNKIKEGLDMFKKSS